MSKSEFDKICDIHTNPLIFKSDKKNKLIKYEDGTPILKDEFLDIFK